MGLDVIIDDPRWDALRIGSIANGAVRHVLDHLGLVGFDPDLAILACDDGRISVLNSEFRGKSIPTNVLSWPAEELGAEIAGDIPAKPQIDDLGNIAIAFETCVAEANRADLPISDHVTHLIVHGTLHLLGYDHERDADGDLMEATEIAILDKLGVANPYSR